MSAKTSHSPTCLTPGTWTVSALDGRTIGPIRQISTDTGGMVRQLQAVAVVKDRTGETDANARLIAAAPDLLAACHELRDALAAAMRIIARHDDDSACGDTWTEAFVTELQRIGVRNGIGVRAETLLAKAEGRS